MHTLAYVCRIWPRIYTNRNTRMAGYTGGSVIGDTVPDDPDDDSERPQHLYEFLRAHKLWLPHTWMSGDDPQLWKTRFPWENIRELSFGTGGKQIDFIALSMFQSVDDVKIARDLTFSSDHFPLTITYGNHNRKSQSSSANHHRQQNHRERKNTSSSHPKLAARWQLVQRNPSLNAILAGLGGDSQTS